MNAINHFKTITKHKLLVMKYCFKVGLYKQGILHDLSKYYRGDVSPNGIQKKVEGYSKAWLHHKGRNKHHLEYWIDYGTKIQDGIVGMKMPNNYVVEMFIDRICACMNYEKEKYKDNSALIYYERGKDYQIIHEDSRELLELLLNKLASEGEQITLDYIKKQILK